uniref:UPF0582 protein At4g09550 family n=1 Tax=Cajanus cajan TaxID=3821 RepID=A0A151TTR1_CAJCA|nr:UPF0582 protein At4g09550 family [Cajanus cajan]
MDPEAARTARESLDLAFHMSNILDTGLDRHTLSVLIALCDLGVNPEALAAVVKELRKEKTSKTIRSPGSAIRPPDSRYPIGTRMAEPGLKHGKTVQDCQSMIKKVDVDGDGMINYKEFRQMMKAGSFAAASLS